MKIDIYIILISIFLFYSVGCRKAETKNESESDSRAEDGSLEPSLIQVNWVLVRFWMPNCDQPTQTKFSIYPGTETNWILSSTLDSKVSFQSKFHLESFLDGMAHITYIIHTLDSALDSNNISKIELEPIGVGAVKLNIISPQRLLLLHNCQIEFSLK